MRTTPGKVKNEKLEDRMKEYESVTTNISLINRIPVYARIDGRAFHTFCRGLNKPFDDDFVNVMQKTCQHLVDKTNAMLGYVQSDEISLVWKDPSKIPFETRLFKLQSVLASIATSAFTLYGMETSLKERILKYFPNFDCRVCNLPNIDECSNMILWRENDCIKNAISSVAQSKFSTNQLNKKNRDDQLKMLSDIGIDFENTYPDYIKRGSYFRRELYLKELTKTEIDAIPEKNRPMPDLFGKTMVTRSHVVRFDIEFPLTNISNKKEVLFEKEKPICK